MIEEKDWIEKRNPEGSDADSEGQILVRVSPSEGYVDTLGYCYVIPEYLVSVQQYLENDKLVEWKHTENWLRNHEEFGRQAQFISGCGKGGAVAIAKDGTLWKFDSVDWSWYQMPDLPKGVRKVNNGD